MKIRKYLIEAVGFGFVCKPSFTDANNWSCNYAPQGGHLFEREEMENWLKLLRGAVIPGRFGPREYIPHAVNIPTLSEGNFPSRRILDKIAELNADPEMVSKGIRVSFKRAE